MKIIISESQLEKLLEGYVTLPVPDGVRLEFWEDDNKLTLDTIVIPKELRGQGMGSEIMNMVCDYADEVGKPIFLTPSSSYGASSVARLEKFYKKFGFVRNRHKDMSMHYLVRAVKERP